MNERDEIQALKDRIERLEHCIVFGKPPDIADQMLCDAIERGDRKTVALWAASQTPNSLLPPELEDNPVTRVQVAKRGNLDRHRRTSRPGPSGNAYANAQRMGASGTDRTGSTATNC